MEEKSITRRRFLTDGAKLAAGAAAGAGVVGLLTGGTASTALAGGWWEPTPTPGPEFTPTANEPTALAIPEWPWKYVELDPQAVAEAAYTAYYEGGCMYGAFAAIIGALQKKAGFPFTQIPLQMSKYGAGGVSGWGTLCGTLNGSSAAINLVAKDYSKIINELMGWYTTTAFPIYQPATPKVSIEATSVSGSPLCHVSVSKWCTASGFKEQSAERKERCARLTADIASKAVELLNQYSVDSFTPSFTPAASVAECGACHLKGGAVENSLGSMDCVQCHEPHS